MQHTAGSDEATGGTPLHEMDPLRRFSSRAADYRAGRPSYPPGAISAVLEGLGEPAGLRAADIGAGTGISAVLLAERGVRVVAVEPNEAMRAAGLVHERVEYRAGTAEATGLAEGSVDLVLCAQAFHWFRHREALAEFRRVLRGSGGGGEGRPSGRLALMWNFPDPTDPFTAEYRRLVIAASNDHPAAFKETNVAEVEASGLFGGLRKSTWGHGQSLDRERLLQRAMSSSYLPTEGPVAEGLRRDLVALHRRHAGDDPRAEVVMRYTTDVYLADVR